jgi:predicted porin
VGLYNNLELKNMKLQKKLIAIAIASLASASAFADSSVSVYGGIDGAIASVSGTGQKSQLLTVSNGLTPTHIGFKAADDFTGSTKIVGVLEYGLDAQDSSALNTTSTYARQKMLALAGDWGTFATGYLQTTGFDWAVKYDPAADSSVSSLQNITGAASFGTTGFVVGSAAKAARAQRALAYISPNYSGFSFAVNYSTALVGMGAAGQPSATPAPTTAYLVSAGYDKGPLSVGLVYASVNNVIGVASGNLVAVGAPGSTQSEYALGASYDFAVTKLSATYQSTKFSTGTSSNKAYSISDVTPVGPGALLLQYAGSSIGTAASSNASGYTVAYLDPVSKKATAYVAYSSVKNGSASNAFSVDNGAVAGATLAAGGSSTLIAAGVSYKF